MKNKWNMGALRNEAGEGGEGGGGEGNAPWYAEAGFAEDTLADEGIKGVLDKYQSPDDFAKGMAGLSRKVGEKGLTLPGDEATPEERGEFFNKLGRPETADAYSWEPGEGFEVDADVYASRTETLHEAGLTDGQHKVVMDLYKEEIGRMNESFQETQAKIATESEASLKDDWGEDYDGNIKAAREVAEKYGIIDSLKDSGMINQVGIIKMLHEVAISTSEGTVDASQKFSSAKEELESIKKNPAYMDRTHPDHKKVIRRTVELSGITGS